RQRPDEHGDAVALGDQLTLGIGETRPEIEHLVDDRALRRPLERDEHLVADREQRVLDDLDGEDVDALRGLDGHQAATSITRLPSVSTRRRWPGNTTVDAASSSTTAGPSSSWPARSSPRS